jgi:hypothetical protein
MDTQSDTAAFREVLQFGAFLRQRAAATETQPNDVDARLPVAAGNVHELALAGVRCPRA